MKVLLVILMIFLLWRSSAGTFNGVQSIQKTLKDFEKRFREQDEIISALKDTTAHLEGTMEELTTKLEKQERHCFSSGLTQHQNESSKSTPSTRANIKTSYGCVGQEVNMTCPDGKTILIERADYGEYYLSTSGCSYPHPLDCTEQMADTNTDEWVLLKIMCDNQTHCSYFFQGSTFVYECTIGAAVTYVSIYYTCLPDDTGDTVAFTVYPSETRNYTEADAVVIFDGALTNIGEHFDLSIDRFFCPRDGLYFFSLHLFTPASQVMVARIMKDGSTLTTPYADNISSVYSTASNSVIIQCYFGETIWVRSISANSQLYGSGARYTAFSGYLLEAN